MIAVLPYGTALAFPSSTGLGLRITFVHWIFDLALTFAYKIIEASFTAI